jgi:hypothetical protein
MNVKLNIIFICTFILLISCKQKEDEYHNITDKIEDLSKDFKGIPLSSDKYTETLKKVEVTENWQRFYIPERKSQIKSFECSECHSKPLNEIQGEENIEKSHWDITLEHANQETMNCVTCHSENNMDELHSITDKPIDFNLSHKLCAQCHQNQFKDWSGGAHGKQIGGWAQPRVSQTCVGCHDPHRPAFEKRWPSRYNVHMVDERK